MNLQQPNQMRLPQIMGILNVTPDSFFADSRVQDERTISIRTEQIVAEGGSIIDVGGCSTRPGSTVASLEEELERVRFALPIVMEKSAGIAHSIDTFRPEVARMAVEEYGVEIINDVSGGSEAMYREAGRLGVAYVLTSDGADVEEIIAHFRRKVPELQDCGCKEIILDPGYGFGKNIDENYEVLRRQREIKEAFPHLRLLAGMSRKRMLYEYLGTTPDQVLNATTCVNIMSLERGADILRVHDVKNADETVKIYTKCTMHL